MKRYLAFIFSSSLLLAGCAGPLSKQPNPGNDPDPVDNPEPEDVCAAGVRDISFEDVLDIPYQDIDVPEETWEGSFEYNYGFGEPDGTYHAFFVVDRDYEVKLPLYGGYSAQEEILSRYVGKTVRVTGKFADRADREASRGFSYKAIFTNTIECIPPPDDIPPLPENVCEGGARDFSFDALDTPYKDIDAPEEMWVGELRPNVDYGNIREFHHAFYLIDVDTKKKISFYGGAANDRQQAVIGEYVRRKVRVVGKLGDNVDVEAREDFWYNLIIPKSIECTTN